MSPVAANTGGGASAGGSPDGSALMRLPSTSRGCKRVTAFATHRFGHEIPHGVKSPGKQFARVRGRVKVWVASCLVSFHAVRRTDWARLRSHALRVVRKLADCLLHSPRGCLQERNARYIPAPTAIERVAGPAALLAWRGCRREFTLAFNRTRAAEWSCETRDSSTFIRSAICFMVSSC